MEYLPAEIQLQILKNLNFDELHKIKQTNRHFYEFINKYENELAHKKFVLFIENLNICYKKDEMIFFKKDFEAINSPLSNHLQEKWLSALDKQIPVFIQNIRNLYVSNVKVEPFLDFKEVEGSERKTFNLKLPLIPKNIEELKIVRYWLKQIFKCVYYRLNIGNFVFNPKMIKLLFDDEEISKLKFNCQIASIYFNNKNTKAWKFTFDRLVISKGIVIKSEGGNITKENINYLLEILLNEGHRIPEVTFDELSNDNQIVLYNNLINHLETSKDLTKIVANISFGAEDLPRFGLIIKGVEMSENNDLKKHYKITNIHNPKIMFSIFWTFATNEAFPEEDFFCSIEIIQIK